MCRPGLPHSWDVRSPALPSILSSCEVAGAVISVRSSCARRNQRWRLRWKRLAAVGVLEIAAEDVEVVAVVERAHAMRLRNPAQAVNAGMASVKQPFRQPAVSINSSVTQERPVSAGHVHFVQVHRHYQILFSVCAGFGKELSRSAGHKALAPELDTVTARRALKSGPVRDRDVAAVGDGVTALNHFPGVVLGHAVFPFLARMPANGSRIKKNLCALQRGEARGLGVPLVPADQHADAGVLRLPRPEAEIARRKVKLLIE